MQVLQVSPYVVHPPSDGGSHRAHGLVAEMPTCGGRVDRYCQGFSSSEYRRRDFRHRIQIADGYVEHRNLHPLHDATKLPLLLGYPNILAGKALSLAPGKLPALAADADVVLVREPWQVASVADLIDRPVVYSSHNVETERFDDLPQQSLGSWAYDRVRALERAALTKSDLVVCTSSRDVNRYRDVFDYDGPAHVAPNATSSDNLRRHRPDSDAAVRVRDQYGIDPDDIVATFVGSNHPPNVEAVEMLLSMVNRIDAHLLVVGSVCDAVSPTHSDVTFAGFVDDFEAHLNATDVALNPMTSGGGTNIKLLDYCARSLPVVTTPFGARGVDINNSEEAVVVDIEEFPDAIAALVADPERRARLGSSARTIVDQRYTWDTVSRELYEHLRERYESGDAS